MTFRINEVEHQVCHIKGSERPRNCQATRQPLTGYVKKKKRTFHNGLETYIEHCTSMEWVWECKDGLDPMAKQELS